MKRKTDEQFKKEINDIKDVLKSNRWKLFNE